MIVQGPVFFSELLSLLVFLTSNCSNYLILISSNIRNLYSKTIFFALKVLAGTADDVAQS